MGYPKTYGEFRPVKGINYDIPTHRVPPEFWTRGQNVNMRKGFAERISGSRAAYGTLPVSVLHALNVRFSSNAWLVWGTNEVHAEIGSNTHDLSNTLSLSSVSDPHEISSTILNGLPVFTNGLDAPHYWDLNTSNDFAPLTGWPASTTCLAIVAFKFHLFAFDMTESGTRFEDKIRWSDAASPGAIPSTWTAAAGNQAGDAIIGDVQGPIMNAFPLRGQLMVCKRSSMYAVDYIGGNEVFSISPPLFSDMGMLARHSGCVIPGALFLVTGGDVVITDGTARRSIANGRVRDALFNSLSTDNYENLFCVYHKRKHEVWICYPEQGSDECNKALIYDIANDSFGEVDLPQVTCGGVGLVNDETTSGLWQDQSYTWANANRKWGQSDYSLANEDLVLGYGTTLEQQDTTDAVSEDASIGKYDMDLGHPRRVKSIKGVHLDFAPGYGTVYVRVGSRMSVQDPIRWTNEVTITEPDEFVPLLVVGKFISLEVRSDGSDVWQFTGFSFEHDLQGYY